MPQANTKLIPNDWRYHLAEDFLNTVQDANNNFYFFIGDHTDHSNSEVQPLDDTDKTTLQDSFRNMIQGKRIANSDVRLIIRNIPWESNKAFAMYDDQEDLTDQDFYAVVNASANYHVFKCLDNNNGANSTVEPNFADIMGANTEIYRTADGYAWKYMYSISSSLVAKFGTANNFPIQANTEVQEEATRGSIDVVKVEDGGIRYNNYVAGTFAGADIQVGGDPLVFQISNSSISGVNGFYTGCLFYISDGIGVGQYELIEDYYANTFGNYIRLADTLTIVPENGSQFQINPYVNVTGAGDQTVNVIARALVNSSSSNTIYRVEIMDRGLGYSYGVANVIANAVVGVTRSANLRPIMSPTGGHGSNPARELLCSKAEIAVQLSNTENDTILVTNQFQQFGIIRNPLFANVRFNVVNAVGIFVDSEPVHKMRNLPLSQNATINSLSNLVIANGGNFDLHLEAGDYVYLTIANGASNQLGVVNSVLNSTAFYLTINAYFDSAAGYLYTVQTHSNCVVQNVISASSFYGTNVHGRIEANDFIIGQHSGAVGYVNNVIRNDISKQYQTFINLFKYNGVVSFGSFEDNEVIFSGNLATSNALLHSAIEDGSNTFLYTSNQVGVFAVSSEVQGNTSGALYSVSNAYSPELVYGAGDIIYLENIDAAIRQQDQTEKFRMAFQF